MTEEAKDNFADKFTQSPDWLQQAWAGAKRRGIGALTQDEINAEIAAYRRDAARRGSSREA